MGPLPPDQIAATVGWWRADLGVFQDSGLTTVAGDGDPIGGWVDQVGSVDMIQTVNPKRPVRIAADTRFNSQSSIDFDGGNDFLRDLNPYRTSDTQGEIWLIHAKDVPSKNHALISVTQDGAPGPFSYMFWSSKYGLNDIQMFHKDPAFHSDAEQSITPLLVPHADNTRQIDRWQSDDSIYVFERDGVLFNHTSTSGGDDGHWFGDMSENERFHFGCWKTSTEVDFFDGQLAEVIVMNAVLTMCQRLALESYLGDRYGFTFPT